MPERLLSLAVAVVLLVGAAGAVGHAAGLGHGRDLVVATARAVGQLLLVGLVVRAVLGTPALAPLYLAVMLTAAALTSGRRLRGVPDAARLAAVAIGSGALVTTVVVFATGALAWSARDVVPFTAQVLGGAMTATTLAGQRLLDDVQTQWDQVEAWLAVGARPHQAVRELGRVAAARALVPSLDQTRNVGLVVLPGAFVGLLLGGASPLEAGRVQLLVLVGLLAAQTVAAVVVTRLLADRVGLVRPVHVR